MHHASRKSLSPHENSPPPAFKQLHVLVDNLHIASLDLGTQSLQSLRHGLGHLQRNFVGEDVEYGKDKEGDAGEAVAAQETILDPGYQCFTAPECVLGAVRRLDVGFRLIRRAAEDALHSWDEGCSVGSGQQRPASSSYHEILHSSTNEPVSPAVIFAIFD